MLLLQKLLDSLLRYRCFSIALKCIFFQLLLFSIVLCQWLSEAISKYVYSAVSAAFFQFFHPNHHCAQTFTIGSEYVHINRHYISKRITFEPEFCRIHSIVCNRTSIVAKSLTGVNRLSTILPAVLRSFDNASRHHSCSLTLPFR